MKIFNKLKAKTDEMLLFVAFLQLTLNFAISEKLKKLKAIAKKQ